MTTREKLAAGLSVFALAVGIGSFAASLDRPGSGFASSAQAAETGKGWQAGMAETVIPGVRQGVIAMAAAGALAKRAICPSLPTMQPANSTSIAISGSRSTC